jgi:hypothetical protein
MEASFKESRSVSWDILGLLSFENQVWVYPKERSLRSEPEPSIGGCWSEAGRQ